MSDLDSTYELLSSMTPKLNNKKTKKKSKKCPTKVAFNNSIRRSSIYDKVPHSHLVRDASVILINDTITSDYSPKQIKILKTPIIISSTSESEYEESEEIIQDTKAKHGESQSKFIDIDNWLSDNEKLDGYSEVYSFKNNSFSDNDDLDNDKHLNDNSREVETPSGTWEVVNIESKLGKEPLRTPVKSKTDSIFDQNEESNNLNLDNKSLNSEKDHIDITETLLDDLYGSTWRENKEKILIRTEPKKQKFRKPVNKRVSATEMKPKNKSKLNPVSPWAARLQGLCDSDSNSSSSSSYKSAENTNVRKLSFSESDEDSNNYSSSNDNIDFDESDNDSLGTRVKKKLAKKSKELLDIQLDKKTIKVDLKTDKKIKKVSPSKTDNKNKTKANSQLGTDKKCSFLKSLSGGVAPWQCDPDAHFFKTNFKTKKTELAKKLFDLYNDQIFENSIPSDTPLQWNDRMRGTAGFCYNRRITKKDGKVIRECRIALATKILDTADRLRDTLVHEMCHAATWLVNNVSDGHGPYWKSWATKAMKIFPELPPIKRCHDYEINTKYTYKCIDCGYSIGRHSKSLDIERKRCGYCYGKFEIFINKVKKNGEKQIAPATPKGKPSGFALFVKENYKLVKRNDMKHGDVMKLLGQQFSELKINKNST